MKLDSLKDMVRDYERITGESVDLDGLFLMGISTTNTGRILCFSEYGLSFLATDKA